MMSTEIVEMVCLMFTGVEPTSGNVLFGTLGRGDVGGGRVMVVLASVLAAFVMTVMGSWEGSGESCGSSDDCDYGSGLETHFRDFLKEKVEKLKKGVVKRSVEEQKKAPGL